MEVPASGKYFFRSVTISGFPASCVQRGGEAHGDFPGGPGLVLRPAAGELDVIGINYNLDQYDAIHEKYPDVSQKYRFELWRDDRMSPSAALKKHGNTTSLILEFLDLDDHERRIRFLQKHRAQIDSRFLTAAAESLGFTDNSDTVEERYDALIRFLKTKAKYEAAPH